MKHIKKFKLFENKLFDWEDSPQFEYDNNYLTDVLQTLIDRGYIVLVKRFSSAILKVFDKPGLVIGVPIDISERGGCKFSDLEDEISHIVSYLGDRFIKSGVIFSGDPDRIEVDITDNYDKLDDWFKTSEDGVIEICIFFDI